jgi:hypothetical protein
MEKEVEQYVAYSSWTREHGISGIELYILEFKNGSVTVYVLVFLYRYIDMWLGHRSLGCDDAAEFESREGLRYLPFLQNVQTVLGGGPTGFFGGVKRRKYKADLSPPSCARVKNEWHSTSTPLTCLRGMDRYKIYLYQCSTILYLLGFSCHSFSICFQSFAFCIALILKKRHCRIQRISIL